MRAATLPVGSMIAVMFMGSTIVTPLYSLYAKQFGFSPIVLTLIYAAYVIGNLVSLFFFGGVSDSAGRRRVVLRAMGLAALSTWLLHRQLAAGHCSRGAHACIRFARRR
jgi:MFS family permease